jgi:hypothetical protein
VKLTRSLIAIIATFLIAGVPLAAPAQFSIGVGFTVGSAPPPMPYYAQPPAPYPNYQWTPGYWGYGSAGYYWVPGTWVAPPTVGVLWTPGYWGYNNGYYGWNGGYWGASVGFYGGINYGYGYPGSGFYGGAWNGGNFAYNTAVTRVNTTTIHNTYNKTVINKNVCNNCKNVSFNGGKGGTTVKPTSGQIQARQNGRAPTTAQKDQARIAGQDRNQLASVNKGKPSLTASDKPFNDSNKPKNFAPVTTADKQAAQKNNTAQNKPQNTMQSKPANITQSKPANKPQNKPTNSMQSKPATQPQHHSKPPSNTMQSANGAHKQTTTHQGNMQSKPPSGKPPQGNSQSKPPQGNGQGKPPQGNGGKPPQG